MVENILVVSTCKEKLHELEFVKPVEDILKKAKIKYFIRHYKNLKKGDLANFTKAIICGTSLQDHSFIQNSFFWLASNKKPVLGICAGMQILGLVSEHERQVKELDMRKDFLVVLKKKTEIGFYYEYFKKDFLGLIGKQEVWHLHNSYCLFNPNWEVFAECEGIPQAVKHREKHSYGVLFHPEVRNKNLILEFIAHG